MNESNTQFRSVLRGYDTTQVDQRVHDLTQAAEAAQREAGELSIQVSKLEAAQRKLKSDIEGHVARTHALEEAQKRATAPTYIDLGQRIGSILMLADEEGNELRTRAQADAETNLALAEESARATRESADGYAIETRSAAEGEAARVLEDSRRRADSILDDADRQAAARREEAEAVYERARAKSAAAAADFETTLAARRETSAKEFAAQVAAAEQQLATIQQRSAQTHHQSEQAQQEAAAKSADNLEHATTQAQTLVAEAKAKAERIRDDSERVLAAATQRRDSINAQLANVRQMLATLSGGGLANPSEPAGPAHAEPEQAVPVTDQHDPGAAAEHESVVPVVTGEQADEDIAHPDAGPDTGEQAEGKRPDDRGKARRQAADVKG